MVLAHHVKVAIILVIIVYDFVCGNSCRVQDTFPRCHAHFYKGEVHYRHECLSQRVYESCPFLCHICDEIETLIRRPTTTSMNGCKADEEFCHSNPFSKCRIETFKRACPNKCKDPCISSKLQRTQQTTSHTTSARTVSKQTSTNSKIIRGCKIDKEFCSTNPNWKCQRETFKQACPDKCKVSCTATTRASMSRSPTTFRQTTTNQQLTTRQTVALRKHLTTTFNGKCADRYPYCFSTLFQELGDCTLHKKECPKTCGACLNDRDICSNLEDRALDCHIRNCQHTDILQRHKNVIKCAKTCCMKGQIR